MMFKTRYRLGVSPMTLFLLAVALAVLLSPANAGKPGPLPEPPVRYTMTLLPPLANSKYCYVGDINNHGEVVGVADMSVGPQHAWFYSPAMGTVDLNNLPSKPAAWRIGSAADINDLGQIVGDAWFQDDDGQTRSHAFLYTPGVGFIALGSLLDYPGVTPRRSTSAARSWVLP